MPRHITETVSLFPSTARGLDGHANLECPDSCGATNAVYCSATFAHLVTSLSPRPSVASVGTYLIIPWLKGPMPVPCLILARRFANASGHVHYLTELGSRHDVIPIR
jgi:hypothetical protein